MDLINWVFYDYLDKFIVVFINDILVYYKSHEKYEQHSRFTLQRLKEKQLHAKFMKCEFWLDKVTFLGHAISTKGISIDPNKIKVVLD